MLTHAYARAVDMTEPYRIRSAETWAQARDDYLAGLSAETVCRRHDLGLSAFRKRARRHGWRRVDQDDPAPDDGLSIYDDIDMDDQLELARLRFNQALSYGRATEAVRWRRLWLELGEARDRFESDLFQGMTPEQIARARAEFRAADEAELEDTPL